MKNLQQFKNIFINWKKLSPKQIAKHSSVVIGSILFIAVLIFIFFHDPLINFFLKDRIIKAFNEANPAYSLKLGDIHYSIWKNQLGVDSIMLKSTDSMLSIGVGSFSVGGIGWIKILLQNNFTASDFSNSVINAQNITFDFRQSQNILHFEKLYLSAYDSVMTADSIKYFSLIDDETSFAKNKFRQTRFRFNIRQIKISGLDFVPLLEGNIYKAGSINIYDAYSDILVNMDKPFDKITSNPQMPNEALSSIKEKIKIDSLNIINGRLKYSERYAVKAKPGIITFNKMNVFICGIANHSTHSDTTVINGEGIFMNSGKMKVLMKIPLTSPDFSLQYSGSLSAMNLIELNSFIEPAEHHQITSGNIESAEYNINVSSGKARGTLRTAYKDLSVSILNKNTGSKNGIFNQMKSLIGEMFVIRGTNMPDKNDDMKIGEIKYVRNPEDNFLQFVWFALRSGLADVVGF